MIPRGKIYVPDEVANIKTRRICHESKTDNLDRDRACERIGDQLCRPNTGGSAYTSARYTGTPNESATYTGARYIGAGGYQAARGAGASLY